MRVRSKFAIGILLALVRPILRWLEMKEHVTSRTTVVFNSEDDVMIETTVWRAVGSDGPPMATLVEAVPVGEYEGGK